MKSSNCNNKKDILILCYRNTTCLPNTVSTTKFPSALTPLLFPIARRPSFTPHCPAWCRSLIVPPHCTTTISAPLFLLASLHGRYYSTCDPPHKQLLMRPEVGGVLFVVVVGPSPPCGHCCWLNIHNLPYK
jgi:hypothetical protein